MSQKYWSYDPDDGLQLHDTFDAARNFADAWLERSRNLSDHDGWHEDTEDCSYGRLEVFGKVVINSRRPVNADDDGEWAATHFTEMVDYQMQDMAQPIDVAAIIAERDAALADLKLERQQHASTREMLRALERGNT